MMDVRTRASRLWRMQLSLRSYEVPGDNHPLHPLHARHYHTPPGGGAHGGSHLGHLNTLIIAVSVGFLFLLTSKPLSLSVAGGLIGVAGGLATAAWLARRFQWPVLVQPNVIAVSVGFIFLLT